MIYKKQSTKFTDTIKSTLDVIVFISAIITIYALILFSID